MTLVFYIILRMKTFVKFKGKCKINHYIKLKYKECSLEYRRHFSLEMCDLLMLFPIMLVNAML